MDVMFLARRSPKESFLLTSARISGRSGCEDVKMCLPQAFHNSQVFSLEHGFSWDRKAVFSYSNYLFCLTPYTFLPLISVHVALWSLASLVEGPGT